MAIHFTFPNWMISILLKRTRLIKLPKEKRIDLHVIDVNAKRESLIYILLQMHMSSADLRYILNTDRCLQFKRVDYCKCKVRIYFPWWCHAWENGFKVLLACEIRYHTLFTQKIREVGVFWFRFCYHFYLMNRNTDTLFTA